MPSKLKNLVRERMRVANEGWAQALRWVRAQEKGQKPRAEQPAGKPEAGK